MSARFDRRRAGHLAEYVALRSVLAVCARLPRRLSEWLGAALGDFVYHVLRIRRRVVEDNLGSTLGQLSEPARLETIARSHYRRLGSALLEYGRMHRTSPAELHATVDLVHPERLLEARDVGRGIVMLTAHFGNWELLGSVCAAVVGRPVHFLARRQSNPYVEGYLQRTRDRLGVGLIHAGIEFRRAFRVLKQGEGLGLLADQDAGPGGLFMDVLGRQASVQAGAALLSVRTGAPIVIGFLVRGRERHQAIFEGPIYPSTEGDRDAEVARLAQATMASLERYILRYPDQYYWVHRRWKTRPPAQK